MTLRRFCHHLRALAPVSAPTVRLNEGVAAYISSIDNDGAPQSLERRSPGAWRVRVGVRRFAHIPVAPPTYRAPHRPCMPCASLGSGPGPRIPTWPAVLLHACGLLTVSHSDRASTPLPRPTESSVHSTRHATMVRRCVLPRIGRWHARAPTPPCASFRQRIQNDPQHPLSGDRAARPSRRRPWAANVCGALAAVVAVARGASPDRLWSPPLAGDVAHQQAAARLHSLAYSLLTPLPL